MIIEDKFTISNPINEVWGFFLDIPRVSTCVPGVENIEQIDDETFNGVLTVKIGPIAANFDGKVTIVELDSPHRLVARAEGKDKRTSSMVSATFTANLRETAPGETEVNYVIDVSIRGRLGRFGQGVIHETAKQIAQSFATCVQERLATEASSEGQLNPQSHPDATALSPSSTSPTPAKGQSSESPSLLAVVLRSIVTSIRARIRRLWPGF